MLMVGYKKSVPTTFTKLLVQGFSGDGSTSKSLLSSAIVERESVFEVDFISSHYSRSMADQVQDWLERFSPQGVQIWCEDPEQTSTGGIMAKTYLTYRILMKQVGRDIIGTRHRYSDFETLRDGLRDKFAPLGILIPSLPPKTSISGMISSKPGDKIKERTLGLTMFCEGIVASPWLRNDPSWKNFMINNSADTDAGHNSGENKLIECLSILEIPQKYTMISKMEEIKSEVTIVEKHVKTLLDKVRVAQNCEKALQNANEVVNSLAAGWLDAEKNAIKTLSGKPDDHENILLPSEWVTCTLNSTVSLLNAKANSQIGNPEYTGLTLATILEQELALIESFKELFKVHDEISKAIDTLNGKLGKAETGKAANKYDQIAEFKRALDDKQKCLTAFYKGFLYFSLPVSAKQRAVTIRKLSAAVAASHLTSSFVYQKACLDYFRSLNINPASAINETSRMLELLGIKQLEKLPDEYDHRAANDLTLFSCSFEYLYQRGLAIGQGNPPPPAHNGGMKGSIGDSFSGLSVNEKANPVADRLSTIRANVDSDFAVGSTPAEAGDHVQLVNEKN